MGATNQSNGASKPNDSSIPTICQFWIKLQATLPSCQIFGMEFSVTIACALALTCVRYLSEFVMVSVFDWPAHVYITKNAAASVPSIVHSTFLVPALIACFWNNPYRPSAALQDEPVWYQQTASALLQLTTAYMLYDGLVNVIWLNATLGDGVFQGDPLMFLGHHIATAVYMISTRVVQAGHQSAMICMLVGEITNPFHNGYFIAIAAQKLDCCNGPFSQQLYRMFEFLFASSYFVARAIVAPPLWIHLTFALVARRNPRIPWGLVGLRVALVWLVELASMPYVISCWTMAVNYLPENVLSMLLEQTVSKGGEL